MNLGNFTVFDYEGQPVAGARIAVFEAGPNGKLLAAAIADEHGMVPSICVETKPVRLVCGTADGTLISSRDDISGGT